MAGTHGKPVRSNRPDGVLVQRGAVWVSDTVAPDFVFASLGQQPGVPPWQPGDPIREVPRQFFGPSNRPTPEPANPVVPIDTLAQLQSSLGRVRAPSAFNAPQVNVVGLGNTGVQPPDPAGDIGTTHYVQSINGSGGAVYRIYDKNGLAVTGTFNLDVLAAGGACATGLGDPIVLFDEIANRWLLTEFSSEAGRSLCIYISQFADPSIAQTWTRYVVQAPSFPDYPKYGVWPDAYYVGTNEGSTGAEIYALDRVKMLAGQPIATQRFVAPELPGFGFQVLQPIDIDGATLPPAGAPGTFVRHRDDEVHDAGANDPAHDRLELFELDIDWTTPANSTLVGPIAVAISEFSSDINGLSSFNAFAQPSGQKLDPLREQVMFRPAYRSYGSFEQIVGNLTTDIDGADTGGVRWFELRRTGGASQPWQLYQEGTVALGDFVDRWMAGIAVDQDGNIGLAYSTVRDGSHPAPNNAGVPAGLRYIGRLDGDPVDVMTSGETQIVAGNGSQAGERWGDYHAMSIDPADGCSFWFTGEYVNSGSWTTRIAGMRHDRCGTPQFMLNSADVRVSACAVTLPQSLPIDVDVLARNGFAGNVGLQFGALPVGMTGGFVPTNVAAPGTSTGTLTLGAGVVAGDYLIPVIGSSGALSKEFAVRLNVASGGAALLAPGDGALAVSTKPTFSWGSNGDTTQYLLQVATDNAFSNIVYSAAVNGTSHVPSSELAFDTVHFWRVQSVNGSCGAGSWSEVRTFTTMSDPTQCPAGTTSTTIFNDPIEPALAGWGVTELPSQGQAGWSVRTTRPNSPTRSWHGNDGTTNTEQRLDTPSIAVPSGATQVILAFSQAYNIEENSATDCWDGATLDLSTNNGSSFSAVPASSFAVNGYTRTIVAAAPSNPLGIGRTVWCGTSLTHQPVVAHFGSLGGSTLKLRFRLGTDSAVQKEGWYVDDVVVKACVPAPNTAPTINASAAGITTLEDAVSAALDLTLADTESPAALTVAATASTDTTLLPLANVAFAGSGLARTVAFTPVANRFGASTVTITVTDAGGLSNSIDVLVTVDPVNDAPSFTILGDRTHAGGSSGAQSVPGFVSSVALGPNESGQAVQGYTIGEVGSSGVISAITLANDGTLDYTLTGSNGTANIAVTLSDDGGTANGGVDTSSALQFTIQVSDAIDAVFKDGFEG